MSKSNRISLAMIALSIIVLACAIPAFSIQDPGAISTAAAETVIAGLTHSALLEFLSPTNPEPTPTFSSEPPTLMPTNTETETLTQTLTQTPTQTPSQTLTATLTLTSTPSVPQISVSVPTNCRVGPGKVYQMVGALLVGEVAEVYGRDPTGNYWYIRNPDSPNNFCWVWGEYATVTGNIAFIPVLTPPPTPTPTVTPTPVPDFEVVYTGLDTCVGWWVEISLQNTGLIPFKSIGLTVKDTVTDVVLANYWNSFTNNDGCLSSNTWDTLGAGKKHVVSSSAFNYDPSGHLLKVTITLCSNIDQNGTCVTRTIKFTP